VPDHFRVLSHWGDASAVQLPTDLLDRVEVIPVSADGPVPAGAFDVLHLVNVARGGIVDHSAPRAFDTMMAIFGDEVRRRLDGQPLRNVVDRRAKS
jgi:hypothetical protein